MKTILMYKTNLFFLLLSLTLLSSCKKDNYHTVVAGYIINAGTKEGIEGVHVYLDDGISSGGGWVDLGSSNTSSNATAEAYTDKNGYFKIELKGEHRAMLSIYKEGYHEFIYNGIGYKGYDDGVFPNEVLELTAKAWFNGVFASIAPNKNDSLYIVNYDTEHYAYSLPYLIYPCRGVGPFQPYGDIYEDDKGETVKGERYLPYKIKFTRNGVWQTKIDSVYIKSHEIYRDTIYY